MSDLRYPIGPFHADSSVTHPKIHRWITEMEEAPAALREAVRGLSEAQLATPYRPEGWTVRQIAHHIADSHINAYVRFRLALTEDEPIIKVYDQDRWSELSDARHAPIASSLGLVEGLHARWVALLRTLSEKDWERRLHHPELGPLALHTMLQLYAWHGRHHVAHITRLRERMGWR